MFYSSNPLIFTSTDIAKMPDLSGLQELNSTIYIIMPLLNKAYNYLMPVFPILFNSTYLNSMISDLQKKLEELKLQLNMKWN